MSTYLRPDLDFDSLVPTFNAGEPFRNVVIDDFFAPEIAQQLADEFPAFDGPAWSVYHNPIEISGLYWHFVDLVWVFIFALFYLW